MMNTACGARLQDDPLNIGVVGTSYYDVLEFSDNRGAFHNSDYIFTLEAGDLPEGLYLYSDGEISGEPTTPGLYSFAVQLYSIDEGYDEDSVSSDIETFDIFVTEASTNINCPSPDDDTTIETYICAGSGYLDTLAFGESFDLDINLFVDFENASEYNINRISFSIAYDDSLFELNEEELNSQLLREASESVDATVRFNTDTAGVLKVTLETDDENSLHYSGRLLNIPFYATNDIPAGSYDFATTITQVISHDDDVDLPENIGLDGTVTVESDILTEE